MHAPSRAAAAALAALFAFAAVGPATAAKLGGPHAAPGHNIFHPKGVAPGQGARDGQNGGGGGGQHHKKNGGQQDQGCTSAPASTDQETITTKKTKKNKKNKTVDVNCIDAK